MGKPAATLGCFHACPKVNPGPVPHIGGPVVQGSPNVFIGGMPAARKGDKIVCVGPPDTITEGSATVFINGKPAARMGDSTAHGGKIMVGNPSVIIGDGTYEYTYDEEFDDDDSSLFPDDYFDFLSGNGISSHETAKTKGPEEADVSYDIPSTELFRRNENLGEFSDLKVPIQMRYVKQAAQEGGIGLNGVKVKIIRDEDLVGKNVFGYTHPDGSIDLYPDAFMDIEQLVKTLGHERTHTMQIDLLGHPETHGPNMMKELNLNEKAAHGIEDSFWQYYQKNKTGRLEGFK